MDKAIFFSLSLSFLLNIKMQTKSLLKCVSYSLVSGILGSCLHDVSSQGTLAITTARREPSFPELHPTDCLNLSDTLPSSLFV